MTRVFRKDTRAKAQNTHLHAIRYLILAIGATGLFAGTAQAQDDWSGFYAGGHAGFADGTADWTIIDSVGSATDRGFGLGRSCDFEPSDVPECSPKSDLRGAIGGLHLGWQKQFGSYVLGAEASYSFAGLDGTTISEIPNSGLDDEFTTEVEGYGTVVARAGWLPPVSAPILVFATAGFAGGDVKTSIDDNVGISGSGEVTERHDGWTAGAGVEYMLRPNVLIGAEYKYVDLGSVEHKIDWDSGDFTSDDVDVTFQSLALRVSYKF